MNRLWVSRGARSVLLGLTLILIPPAASSSAGENRLETVRGHYGEYKVLVDGEAVVDGGPMSVLGLLPSARDVVAKVRARLTPDGPRSAMGA